MSPAPSARSAISAHRAVRLRAPPAQGRAGCRDPKGELRRLADRVRRAPCFEVEVCPSCRWNHLLSTYPLGAERSRLTRGHDPNRSAPPGTSAARRRTRASPRAARAAQGRRRRRSRQRRSRRSPASRRPKSTKSGRPKSARARANVVGCRRVRRSFLWRGVAGSTVILLLIAGIGAGFLALDSIELPEAAAPVETSFICLADVGDGACGPDNSVAQYSSSENRIALTYDEMPPDDGPGRARRGGPRTTSSTTASTRSASPGRSTRTSDRREANTQGGSTITQQYVKTVVPHQRAHADPQAQGGGARGQARAQVLQDRDPRALPQQVYFGRGAYGVEAAARAYFDMPARDLTLDQAALLAGADPSAPRRPIRPATPRRRCGAATACIDAMVDDRLHHARRRPRPPTTVPLEGHVVEQLAKAKNLGRRAGASPAIGGEYIAEWVRQQLNDDVRRGRGVHQGPAGVPHHRPGRGSRRARGDPENARPARRPGGLAGVDRRGRADRRDGGRHGLRHEPGELRARARPAADRVGPPGSTFKPFALAAFVEQGNSVKSVYTAPTELVLPKADEGKDWVVKNFEDEDLGTVTVEEAHVASVNTVYAQIMQTGGRRRPSPRWRRRLGVTAPVPAGELGGARHDGGVGARHGHGLLDLRQPRRPQDPAVPHPAGRGSTTARCCSTPGRARASRRCSRPRWPTR